MAAIAPSPDSEPRGSSVLSDLSADRPASREGSTPSSILPWPHLWFLLLSLAALTATAALFLLKSPTQGYFLLLVTTLVCTIAAWFDAATGRIPNPLTYTAILLGLAFSLLATLLASTHFVPLAHWLGAPDLLDSALGLALAGGIGLVCLIFAGLGGGDLKLLAALGALLGFHAIGNVLIWALIAALPYAIVNLLLAGRLNTVCKIAALHLLALVYLHQPAAVEVSSKRTIPLAIPLLAGLLLALAFPNTLGL